MLLEDKILECQKQVGKNISRIMSVKEITQERLRELCLQGGCAISQSTISNAKNGKCNLTLANLVAIAYALEVNITDLLAVPRRSPETTFRKEDVNSNLETDVFQRNPNSIYLQGYLGQYHVLFYKTSGPEDELVRGTLYFQESDDKKTCMAILNFPLGNSEDDFESRAEKIYKGELVVSHPMRAAYCCLTNADVGEMCMLIFQHIFTSNSLVSTIMAAAVTTASGANRRPTVHRICLSRNPVDDSMLEYVKGQLLMNTADIYLTEAKMQFLLQRPDIPDSFKAVLQRGQIKGKCYCVPEAFLYDNSLNEVEQQKLVSLVRANSQAPKYNKISKRTDEILYALVGQEVRK